MFKNSPNFTLEAFSRTRPVIGSNIGGIPELVEHGKTGILCESGNSSYLASEISKVIADPDLTSSLGNTAYQTLKHNWPSERHYARLMGVYQSLLA